MKKGGNGPKREFPVWVQNMLAALVLFLLVVMITFLIQEYNMLTSTDGDAGYPFGIEEAGPEFVTKEFYLARSRWLIAIGGTLGLAISYALWRKRMTLLWFLTLLTIFGALTMMMTSPR